MYGDVSFKNSPYQNKSLNFLLGVNSRICSQTRLQWPNGQKTNAHFLTHLLHTQRVQMGHCRNQKHQEDLPSVCFGGPFRKRRSRCLDSGQIQRIPRPIHHEFEQVKTASNYLIGAITLLRGLFGHFVITTWEYLPETKLNSVFFWDHSLLLKQLLRVFFFCFFCFSLRTIFICVRQKS